MSNWATMDIPEPAETASPELFTVAESEVNEQRRQDLLKTASPELFTVTEGTIRETAEKYMQITVTGVDDAKNFKAAQDAKKIVVKARTTIESKRKELKEPHLAAGKEIDNYAKRLTELIAPVEKHLINQIQTVEREIARQEAIRLDERLDERLQRLNMIGAVQQDTGAIRTMEESTFGLLLIQLAEQIRIKRDQDQEREKLAAERAQFDRERAAEREKLDQERAAFDELTRLERIAREQAQQAEQQRIDEQRRALQAEADRQQHEIQAAETAKRQKILKAEEDARREAMLPYAERLHIFAAQIEILTIPHDVGRDDVQVALTGCANRIRYIANGL